MFSLYRAVFPFTYDWFVTNENLNVFSSNQFPASAAGPRRSSAALLCSFFIGCLFLGFCFLLSILNSFTSSLVILTELIWNRVYRTNVDGRNMPSESGKWIIWLLSAHRHDGLNPALSVQEFLCVRLIEVTGFTCACVNQDWWSIPWKKAGKPFLIERWQLLLLGKY